MPIRIHDHNTASKVFFVNFYEILFLGRVYPAVMWDYYNNGASIRMINPQYFHNRVWRLCATLQVGSNLHFKVCTVVFKGRFIKFFLHLKHVLIFLIV